MRMRGSIFPHAFLIVLGSAGGGSEAVVPVATGGDGRRKEEFGSAIMAQTEVPAAAAQDVQSPIPAMADGLPVPQRFWASISSWLAAIVTVIDGGLVAVALPSIAQSMGTDDVASTWVLSACQIATTIALLPAAALGEIIGYRRVFLAGLGLLAVSSAACALAGDLTTLAIARFFMGLGMAGCMGLSGAMVRLTWPSNQLGRGVGYLALAVAVGSAAGPSVAAAILTVAEWPWIFACTIPFTLLSIVIGMRCLPHSHRAKRRFDVTAALLNAVAFGAIFLALSQVAHGQVSIWTGIALLIGVVAGTVLIKSQWRQTHPLVPLDLIRIPVLRRTYMISIFCFAAQMVSFVGLPFYLQARFGLSPLEIGLVITPWPVAVMFTAPWAGRLVERHHADTLGGIGLVCMATGLILVAILPEHASQLDIAWRLALCGAGFGFFQAPNNRTMLGGAPRERSGSAAGMQATSRLFGQTMGAVLAALVFRITPATSSTPLNLAAAIAVAAAFISFSGAVQRRKLRTA
ncbi:MAG: putative transport protein family [Alphaproteobacteria bacterium]|nr:putative transport protein family [Alphaproteobacteria bacterium]